ncbi:hypothetical protein CIPAW_13G015600 [Carya illinoinensis]|uniref:Uncharacterized protein n=1 Tax=Carya illinoinensis TaxID=32201 RepID=A0A8T1NNQ2_CARIL|nr:hypothetical protein CIPAW_13G015600 [Carya illinoinensis]
MFDLSLMLILTSLGVKPVKQAEASFLTLRVLVGLLPINLRRKTSVTNSYGISSTS